MKWYTAYIISFICINAWVWVGTYTLRESPASTVYMNLSESSSTAQEVMKTAGLKTGDALTGETGPGTKDFMTVNKTLWQALITFDIGAVGTLVSEEVAGYIAGISDYIKNQLGWINSLAAMTGGMFTIFQSIGIPQPWAGILTGVWSLLFIFALISFITGRDT